MNRYPLWKYLLVVGVLLLGGLFALPNVFPEDPSLQVSARDNSPLTEFEVNTVRNALVQNGLTGDRLELRDGRITVRLHSDDEQQAAAEVLRAVLNPQRQDFVVALVSEPRLPGWVRSLGLSPMSLGLDLRGGVHFLFEVDVDAAVEQTLRQWQQGIESRLADNNIPRQVFLENNELAVVLNVETDVIRAESLIRTMDDTVPDIRRGTYINSPALFVTLTETQIAERQDFAIQQNILTLRNRVNELGVAEPVVTRQGANRILVQLPGVQDPRQAEVVLGATATMEFRMVSRTGDPFEAHRLGRSPIIGAELFYTRDGVPYLLDRQIIATGDNLTGASTTFDQGRPAVSVNLDAQGGRSMLATTQANLGRPMAVLFTHEQRELTEVDGQLVEVSQVVQEIISVATIQGTFSNRFVITGLGVTEASDLALLLRAGAMAAPIYKVEERTIGPSLGQDNIDRGMQAVVIGFVLVALFMALYYRVFGLVANVALAANVILIVALLSMLQAALTLPGIAGIVLTIGMAIDANVLIYERIREELRNGMSPHAAINAGYDKAFSAIVDANLTTLIAAVVLFVFGTGPIRGFAVTLSLGLATSMFTALVGTRALVNLIYGGRRVERLSIGRSIVHARPQ